MISIFRLGDQRFGPFDGFVAGIELQRDDEQFAPGVGLEFIGGVFQSGNTFMVQTGGDQTVAPQWIALAGKVVRKAAEAVLGTVVAVVVITGADHVGEAVVQSAKGSRGGLPLLFAGLVAVDAVGNAVFVLLDKVTGAEHGADAERVGIVDAPGGHQFEEGLVGVEFGVALRVGQQDHGKRSGRLEFRSQRQHLCRGGKHEQSGQGGEQKVFESHVGFGSWGSVGLLRWGHGAVSVSLSEGLPPGGLLWGRALSLGGNVSGARSAALRESLRKPLQKPGVFIGAVGTSNPLSPEGVTGETGTLEKPQAGRVRNGNVGP